MDYKEPQESKEIPAKEINAENVSDTAKASIQGVNAKEDGGQTIDQSDYSQEYVDDKTKYMEDLLAHKQNVVDHSEDWKKSGFSMENELEATDAEIANSAQLLEDEFKKKYENK